MAFVSEDTARTASFSGWRWVIGKNETLRLPFAEEYDRTWINFCNTSWQREVDGAGEYPRTFALLGMGIR
jgi:hypothetical protein